MKTSSIASILIAGLSSGGAIGGYFYFRPNNLESYLNWKGYKLANSDNLFKSIYEENKDSFSVAFGDQKEESDKWKVIKNYCTKSLKKSNYSSDIDKSIKWCIDNVKTVKGQMLKEGLKIDDLMSDSKDYKVASVFQGNRDFWALVGLADSAKLETKAESYKSWCENTLKKEVKNSLVKLVDNFCHKKKYSDFKGKLDVDKYTRLKDEEIGKKYEALKLSQLTKNTGSNTLEIIGGGSENWKNNLGVADEKWEVDKNKFEEKYKEYCNKQDKENFLEDNKDYLKLYSEYLGLCTKKN